ncbi:MAG: hypothetical protein JZU50_08315 [Desulfobulbaceae bacterium]|jgi:hypothetical protein|nr:hypothetical protein [Desulfobulbaceae bacterium]
MANIKNMADVAEWLSEQASKHAPATLPGKKPAAKPIQLPLWAEVVRASPNAFLRSAVFPAIQGKTRDYQERSVIAAQNGYEIRLTGRTLDQADFDVWLFAVHLARCTPLGTVCEFNYNSFLKGINRCNGRSDYEWLKKSIARLRSALLEIKIGPQWCTYNLIEGAAGDDSTTELRLQFSPLLIELFAADAWTAVQWEERLQLKGKPLALWLHGYYASHAAPYPVKVETLQKMSGSSTKELRYFKAALKAAFVHLEAIGIRATIKGDLVTVKRMPSATQGRHLVKKIAP